MQAQTERIAATLVGRYRIDRELGAGGMATVYLAHDERHHRSVALKVLKPELAAVIGAERFLNEIKTTANLQHPHILPLHDSGEANGTVWYVMPLVEGESLRDRLQRETQLPIDDALTIVREVASALDYAHRHGIIHRDIKPENILLHDGRAVVADFGIALAMSRTEGGVRLTETGMSLGTPHYMSPEQALGERSVDARTDVYALGAVLYEMLVGEPPFTGPTVQAIIAKVMSAPAAPISALRPSVPASVEAAVMRALAKVPADRFKSAADFASALRSVDTTITNHAVPGIAPVSPAAAAPRGPMRLVPWIIAAGAVIAAGALATRDRAGGTAIDTRVTAAVLPLPLRTPTDFPLNEVGPLFSIAPDGSFLVYVGPDPEVARATALWRRPLDRLDATAIPGTRGAQLPHVMPDGKTVQFYRRTPAGQGNARFEIAVSGGVPTSAPPELGIRRLPDGRVLVFADSVAMDFRLVRPGDGQQGFRPAPAAALSRTSEVSRDGQWLARPRRTGQADSIVLRTLEAGTAHVIAAGVSAKFLEDDVLAFRAPDGTLQVGRLKPDRSGFVAPPVAMVPNVSVAGDGSAAYAVSDDGTLVYVPGGASSQSRLTWVTPQGEQTVPNVDSRVFGGVTLAPDARRAALSVGALAGGGDVWIAELGSGTFNPLTSDGVSSRPWWLRDNRTVTYLYTTAAVRMEQTARDVPIVSRRAVDTSQPADSIRGPWPDGQVDELVWSPDNRFIAMRVRRGTPVSRDIIVRRVDGDSLVPFAAEPGVQERGPRFSPDGKWLLYVSNRSGRDEIYAETFPGGGNRVQLSLDGGREGTWSRDGSRVFYRGLDGWMMAARVTPGAALTVTARDRLFDASPYLANQFLAMYDVAADGRFLMLKLDSQAARTDVIIIRNWVQQAKARLRDGAR